jgi:hypothetical protein
MTIAEKVKKSMCNASLSRVHRYENGKNKAGRSRTRSRSLLAVGLRSDKDQKRRPVILPSSGACQADRPLLRHAPQISRKASVSQQLARKFGPYIGKKYGLRTFFTKTENFVQREFSWATIRLN